MLGLPPKPKLLLHELILWVSLLGIMKFIHFCWKLGKWLKVKENSENMCQKEKWQQKIIEIWILLLKEGLKTIL